MDYSRWMSLNGNIHGKKLANICLPMTHDTGTFDLSDTIVEPSAFAAVDEKLEEIAELMTKLGLPVDIDPVAWLLKESIGAIKGLATATKKTVREQLNGGIRGFDFRVYYAGGGVYYTYHGLQSTTTLDAMLNEIRLFLEQTSRPDEKLGEIVYVNLSHYLGFTQSEDYHGFGSTVKSHLGEYAYRNYGDNDPFNATYNDIIGQDGVYKSRVILVSETDLDEPTYIWPQNYCPPDENREMNVLYGKYTDSTDLSHVIDTQVSQFQTALSQSLPFVNYMTMTPSGAQYANIVGSSLYGTFLVLAADFLELGKPELADAAAAIAAVLLVDREATNLLGWLTLEELESQITSQLPELVDTNFLPYGGDVNEISMIFCDFWENSELVDLCIALSNDFEMEWSGNTPIQVSDGNNTYTVDSDEGPSAAMYNEQLHMVYKGKDTTDMWMAVYDPATETWISNQSIKNMTGGSSINATTDKSPAVAAFDNMLYVVWKDAGKNSIRCARWTGVAWNDGYVIPVAETNNSPFIATYDGTTLYKYKDDDGICCATYSTSDYTWTGGTAIKVSDNEDEPYPRTNKRPTLVEYGGLLYLMYKGESDALYQSTWDGLSWSGNIKIKNEDADYDPKSSEGPGLSPFAGDIYMAYKGSFSSDMWLSYFNGTSWNGNIEMKDHTSIDPKTDRSPCCVRVGLDLFLIYQSDDDVLYLSTLTPAAL